MKNLARLYEKLTAAERAALTIEALARQDMEEADLLADSCPEFDYRAKDLAYTQRLSDIHQLAQFYQAEVLTLRVQLMAAILSMLRHKGGDAETADAMYTQVQILAASIEAWHLAWVMFCTEIGFDPDAVLRAFGIEQLAIPASKAIEPAREQIDAAASLLSELWQASLGVVAGNGVRQ